MKMSDLKEKASTSWIPANVVSPSGAGAHIPWDPEAISFEINELIELAQRSGNIDLMLTLGGLRAYYREYERTNDAVLLENIIMDLFAALKDLLARSGGVCAGAPDSFDGISGAPSVNSFMYIDRETGAARGNCFAGAVDESALSVKRTVSLRVLLEAFKLRLYDEAEEKGRKTPVGTAKIYANCILNELVYNNGESNIYGEVDVESIRTAIRVAVERLRKEEMDRNASESGGEYKRYKKNEIAALNKLDKLLDVLAKELGLRT